MSTQPAADAPLTPAGQQQLGRLFDTHADRLYRLARRLVPSADEALDLVQEAFLKLAQSSTTVPTGPAAEEAWLVRILVNIQRDHWRRESVRLRHARHLRPTPPTHPERLYLLQVAVWQALDTLPPRRRAVLVMHELEGLAVPAIASLLGIAAITVRWHLARARRELARHIRPNSGAAHEHDETTVAGSGPAPSRGASQS